MLEATMKRFKRSKRGISTVIVVMLSLVLVVIVVANIVLWSYQMNQFDLERMQEKVTLSNVEHVTRSPWFTSTKEYAVIMGKHVSGTYNDTRSVGNGYETFKEETVPAYYYYNPAGYALAGSTKYASGSIADLATNNGQYMTFKSYSSAFSPRILYVHQETTTIAGSSYYQLRLNSGDASGTSLYASGSTTGRKLWGRSVYMLTGIASVPATTWTVYYRAYVTHSQLVVHCDVDVLVRKADGTARTAIAADVANSTNLGTSWSTVSATYAWNSYAVVDETDYLEIDFYAHVTSSWNNRDAYLRIDDSALSSGLQTRVENIMLPSKYTATVELYGMSSLQSWQNLTWTADSAFTAGDENVTLQMYNYNTNQYPTSGDGFISYISSSTPNTDETKSQTIAADPTNFRNSTGGWKMKITGIKQTSTQFNLKTDWVEFKVMAQSSSTLDIDGVFTLDMVTYPLANIKSIEVQLRYRATDSFEKWFLKAYNWTKGQYCDTGFNLTSGDSPTAQFKYYSVNMTNVWQSYVYDNGTVRIEFSDISPDSNQTAIDIDFLGVRAIINGVKFSLQNGGPLTSHVVSLWITNSIVHKRYDANFFINSGVEADYIRPDIPLPAGNFTARIVTERGNIAVVSG